MTEQSDMPPEPAFSGALPAIKNHTLVGSDERRENADEGALSRTIRPLYDGDLTRSANQIDFCERAGCPEHFCDAAELDSFKIGCVCHRLDVRQDMGPIAASTFVR